MIPESFLKPMRFSQLWKEFRLLMKEKGGTMLLAAFFLLLPIAAVQGFFSAQSADTVRQLLAAGTPLESWPAVLESAGSGAEFALQLILAVLECLLLVFGMFAAFDYVSGSNLYKKDFTQIVKISLRRLPGVVLIYYVANMLFAFLTGTSALVAAIPFAPFLEAKQYIALLPYAVVIMLAAAFLYAAVMARANTMAITYAYARANLPLSFYYAKGLLTGYTKKARGYTLLFAALSFLAGLPFFVAGTFFAGTLSAGIVLFSLGYAAVYLVVMLGTVWFSLFYINLENTNAEAVQKYFLTLTAGRRTPGTQAPAPPHAAGTGADAPTPSAPENGDDAENQEDGGTKKE